MSNSQYFFVPPTVNANHEPLFQINNIFLFNYTLSDKELKKTVEAHPDG